MFTLTLTTPQGESYTFDIRGLYDTRILAPGSEEPEGAGIFTDYGLFIFCDMLPPEEEGDERED